MEESPVSPPPPHPRRLAVVIGIVATVAVACAIIAYLIFATPFGAAVVARYFATESPWPASEATTSAPVASQQVLVPRTFAPESYYYALNFAVQDFDLFGTLNNTQLSPLLLALNARQGSSDPTFAAHIAAAQALVSQEQTLLEQFSSDLDALSTADKSVTDPETLSLTQAFIDQGTTTVAAAQQYDTFVEQALTAGSADSVATMQIYEESSILALRSAQLQSSLTALDTYFSNALTSGSQTR